MRQWLFGMLACLIWAFPQVAGAQGFLLPEHPDPGFRMPRPPMIMPPMRPVPPPPPQTYDIKELTVQGSIQDQIAKVQVTQTFVNTGSRPMEVSFVFPLPYDGAVDRMTFLVDGKEYDAKLLDASEARQIYEGYVRRYQDPALLEWIGASMFKTSVFPVPAGASRSVTLRYSQVCRQSGGLTELLFPLSTAKYTTKPIEKLSVQFNIESRVPLKNLYSPSYALDIKRPDDQHAVVSYQAKNETPTSDFRLLFDVGKQAIGANLLSYRPEGQDEGYFLLLATPEVKSDADAIVRKNVMFVVDRSGSMTGPKIEQAKSALKFVLNNLREGDTFNIVAYDTEVETFRPEMQRFNDDTRKAALGFVEGLYPGGSTNIDGALKAALAQLTDSTRPNYVIFLTDGLPTAGVTGEAQIVAGAKERNSARARVFAFGVGYDVNSRLLDKLARTCFGQSEYVRPNEDIEAHVSRLYSRIGAPALTDVKVEVLVAGTSVEQGPVVNRVYPKEVYDLFAGDQLVLVGRFKKHGDAQIKISGSVNGQPRNFEFPAKLVEKSADSGMAFIEKLWAARRIGEIIDHIDLHGSNKELVEELVMLSKQHGILTPYTSFLADDKPAPGFAGAGTRPVSEPAGPGGGLGGGGGGFGGRSRGAALKEAEENLRALRLDSGVDGFVQRANKSALQNAAAAPAAGLSKFRAVDTDREVVVQNVQNVGAKTFFRQGERWVDSTATEAEQLKARKVARFSDDYFALIAKHGRDSAQYLAIDGRLIVKLNGETLEIE